MAPLDNARDFTQIERGPGKLDQKPEIVRPVGRDLPAGHDHRAAKEVALEILVAFAERRIEVLLSFHFLGQEHGTAAADHFSNLSPHGSGGDAEIDLDIAGNVHQGLQLRTRHKVIQGEFVAHIAKLDAGLNQLGIGRDGFEYFDYGCPGRQQSDQFVYQSLMRAIHKRKSAAGERLYVHGQAVIQRLPGRGVPIATEAVLPSAAEEQFVADHFAAGIEDRLAGEESAGLRRQNPVAVWTGKGGDPIDACCPIVSYARRSERQAGGAKSLVGDLGAWDTFNEHPWSIPAADMGDNHPNGG